MKIRLQLDTRPFTDDPYYRRFVVNERGDEKLVLRVIAGRDDPGPEKDVSTHGHGYVLRDRSEIVQLRDELNLYLLETL